MYYIRSTMQERNAVWKLGGISREMERNDR